MIPTILLYYYETNLICIIILAFIMYMDSAESRGRAERCGYRRVIMTIILYCLSDMAAITLRGTTLPWARIILQLANTIYVALPLLMLVLWEQYIHFHTSAYYTFSPKMIRFDHILYIGVMVLFVLSLSSPFTNFSYYLDENNIYHRLAGGYLVAVVCYLLFIYETMQVLAIARKTVSLEARRDARIISLFALPCGLFSLLQVVIYGITIAQVGYTLGIIIVFISRQRNNISKDELTGLSNRREYENTVDRLSRNAGKLMIAMVDIDFFKNVNDHFGHEEGDKAIRSVAELLDGICIRNRSLGTIVPYRYGGDEFVLLSSDYESEEIKTVLENALSDELESLNSKPDRNHSLCLSIGIVCGSYQDASGIRSLIAAADREMYRAKKLHHQQAGILNN